MCKGSVLQLQFAPAVHMACFNAYDHPVCGAAVTEYSSSVLVSLNNTTKIDII